MNKKIIWDSKKIYRKQLITEIIALSRKATLKPYPTFSQLARLNIRTLETLRDKLISYVSTIPYKQNSCQNERQEIDTPTRGGE